MRTVSITGPLLRVADPDWVDPLDPSYAAEPPGQRWNPPGLPCLYLNRNEQTARANVLRLFEGLPYGPEDLDPATGPLLLEVTLPAGSAADAFTDDGLSALGLPTTYPRDIRGDVILHAACQPIGQAVFDEGHDGVEARSAANGGTRELAWFPRAQSGTETGRRSFDEWW